MDNVCGSIMLSSSGRALPRGPPSTLEIAMKNCILAAALTLPAVAFATAADPALKAVVVPADTTPFKVSEQDIVRVTGKGIAGAKIEAKAAGAAQVAGEAAIYVRIKGNAPIGTTVREFDIKATAKGKAKVTITVTPPQPGAKPIVTVYEYEVE